MRLDKQAAVSGKVGDGKQAKEGDKEVKSGKDAKVDQEVKEGEPEIDKEATGLPPGVASLHDWGRTAIVHGKTYCGMAYQAFPIVF